MFEIFSYGDVPFNNIRNNRDILAHVHRGSRPSIPKASVDWSCQNGFAIMYKCILQLVFLSMSNCNVYELVLILVNSRVPVRGLKLVRSLAFHLMT